MMERNIKILIFVILVLLFLNISVFIVNQSADCSKCRISFKNTKIAGQKAQFLNEIVVHPSELLDSLKENKCFIFWDRTYGYKKQ